MSTSQKRLLEKLCKTIGVRTEQAEVYKKENGKHNHRNETPANPSTAPLGDREQAFLEDAKPGRALLSPRLADRAVRIAQSISLSDVIAQEQAADRAEFELAVAADLLDCADTLNRLSALAESERAAARIVRSCFEFIVLEVKAVDNDDPGIDGKEMCIGFSDLAKIG